MSEPTPEIQERVKRANSWISGILAAYFLVGFPVALLSDTPFTTMQAGWSIVAPVCFFIAWTALLKVGGTR